MESGNEMDHCSLGLKILIADDSSIYRKLVERSLSREHYTIFFANDGRQAMDLFAEHKPDILITDWTMPDISGIELCQSVRREFRHLYPYIILLTSHADKEQVIQGLAAGADDYLTKPFHPGELQARVRVGRRIAELHHELREKNCQMEELALSDSLTGLPNRRAIENRATQQISAAVRHKFPIWIVMADLDYFKKINDTYGHDTGDSVLRGFAEILKSNTRQSDICGRLGGEEFIAIITHVEEKDNILIAIERIRKQFESREFPGPHSSFHATASFGIAGFGGGAPMTFHDLLTRADTALYSAKHSGRNCISFALG